MTCGPTHPDDPTPIPGQMTVVKNILFYATAYHAIIVATNPKISQPVAKSTTM